MGVKTVTEEDSEEESMEDQLAGIQLTDAEEDYNMMTINEVKTIPSNTTKTEPHFLTFDVDGQAFSLEMDTGANITAIPLDWFEKKFSQYELAPKKKTLRNYDETEIKLLGTIKPRFVKYKQTLRDNLEIEIVEKGQVVGRNWLESFEVCSRIIEASKVSGNTIKNIQTNSIMQHVNKLRQKHPDVFSPGWGTFKNGTISLKLKKCER